MKLKRSLRLFTALAGLGIPLASLALADSVKPTVTQSSSLIPLDDFLKEVAFDEIKISPDGTKVAALSMWKGNKQLYVIDLKTKKPAMLTGMEHMGVAMVNWVGNNRLLFTGTEEGGLTGGIFAIDADGKNSAALVKSAPQEASSGRINLRGTYLLGYYGKSTEEVLIVNNERRAKDADVYRLHVRKGSKKMVAWNPGFVTSWLPDHEGRVRVGVGEEGLEQFLVYRAGETGEFTRVKSWKTKDGEITPLAFDEKNELIYARSSIGRNTEAIVLLRPDTGEEVKELHANDTYDCGSVILDRTTHALLGFHDELDKPKYTWTDETHQKLQAMLDEALPGTLNAIYSRSWDNKFWIISASSDRDPGTFYLFEPKELKLEKLVSRAPWLKPSQLSEMRPVSYTARDGMTIHGYLTLPAGLEAKNLPLIVNPHGGPWVRDEWGYNFEVQFLASRGYAVLQMNFRGSTGYGKKLLRAGYGQWGLAMQDDITDGVKWAIAQGFADPARVGIYGGSYGGYACMAGLAFTPELYRCGINYVGVTDLKLLQKTIPESWERGRQDLEEKTGTSKELMEATSPMKHSDKIVAPVFFAYGEIDDRVDLKHGTKIYSALKNRGLAVEWMSRPDEGHGYRKPENKKAYYSQMESFLAKHMTKSSKGTTATVTVGESVPRKD